MSTYFFVAGRHTDLSLAELVSIYPDSSIQPFGETGLLAELPAFGQKEFDRMGGFVKAAKIMRESKRETLIADLADRLASHYSEVMLDYGLSLYGMPEKQIRPLLLNLKKTLRAKGIKSRFINKNFTNISAAQYKSIRKKGVELVVIKNGPRLFIGETVGVQNIDAYGKRDYDKPFRDMRMGMLPPKLAQILINLTGVKGAIWDPFCGSGTLVMEGLLMGHNMIGSDISPERIEGAKKNVEWLKENFPLTAFAKLMVHDAVQPFDESFDAVAFEGDLGIPHNQSIRPADLEVIIDQLNDLYIRFFRNLKAMKHSAPVVAALPLFRMRNEQEKTLKKALEEIEKMGFKKDLDLRYFRENQAVGRAIYRFIRSSK